MTDLERAQDIEAMICLVGIKHGLNVRPAIARDMASYIQECTLAAARREGAEEMRERAAQTARNAWIASREYIADQIATLPLTPEEPT